MPRLPIIGPIEFLVDQKYPKRWGRSHDQAEADEALREAYEEELRALPAGELSALLTLEKAKLAQANLLRQEREEAARFFNQPTAVANFEHWSRASYWSLEEACSLALGKSPSLVNSARLREYSQVSAFAVRYFRLLDLAKRAVWAKQLWEPSYPTVFLAWAKRMDIAVDPRLVAAVEARGHQIADWKTMYDDAVKSREEWREKHAKLLTEYNKAVDLVNGYSRMHNQHVAQLAEQKGEISRLTAATAVAQVEAVEPALATRERESLLRLVIGMAIGGYRYDPNANRNSATSEIATDLVTAGVPLDVDTVRKWLREGSVLLSQTEQKDP